MHVGGDFYSLLPLSETAVDIFVADVMGHGVAAALLMSAINAMVRIESAKTADPVEFLRRLHRVITRRDEVKFTALYMVVDTAEGRIRYSVAGHQKPIIARAGSREARELRLSGKIGGPALMLFDYLKMRCSIWAKTSSLSGDRILLFTDGLTEMPSAPGSEDDLVL
jgi:sigma-B regulation protein RsbU (phosphoserine phosphatase)